MSVTRKVCLSLLAGVAVAAATTIPASAQQQKRPNIVMLMMGNPHSYPADSEGYKKFMAERNIEPLPNPAVDFPLWMGDGRR